MVARGPAEGEGRRGGRASLPYSHGMVKHGTAAAHVVNANGERQTSGLTRIWAPPGHIGMRRARCLRIHTFKPDPHLGVLWPHGREATPVS